MDFFGHQDAARRASRRLTILFATAVLAVVVLVTVTIAIATGTAHPAFLGVVALLTAGVILAGSMFKTMQLRAGGSAVAEMMDGRRLTASTTDFDEKRLLNVVEEMALASGVPVPLVYVMDDEAALNAFAAGHTPHDAAIAVTHGLMKSMNRDEMQGVIAHEFSHILNGDMRLNLRMIGLLFGIEMIGHAGRLLLDGNSRSRSRDSGNAGWIGLGLLVIGFGGVFCANAIRAAIGRQREYLADASAVQFTRNPEGIGSALVKIGAKSGMVEHRNTDAVSHMFIAQALGGGLAGLFATHPPIEERIERVLGKGAAARLAEAARGASRTERRGEWRDPAPAADAGNAAFGRSAAGNASLAAQAGVVAGFAGGAGARTVDQVVASIGNPQREHVDYARALVQSLPDDVRNNLATPEGAVAVLVALLVPESSAGTDLRAAIAGFGEASTLEIARWIGPSLGALDPHLRLPVATLAFPALRALPASERRRIVELLRTVIAADRRVTPFEFALSALAARQLDPQPDAQKAGAVPLERLAEPVALVLSLFVRTASQGSLLFDRMAAELRLAGLRLAAPSAIQLEAVESALAQLARLAAGDKARLIRVCLQAVLADEEVSVREAELMRAVCACLDAPLPPIIDRAAIAALTATESA